MTFKKPIKMLNQKEVAKKLGVSERTIGRWVDARKIPYYNLNGIKRFDEDVINAWLEKRRVRTRQ